MNRKTSTSRSGSKGRVRQRLALLLATVLLSGTASIVQAQSSPNRMANVVAVVTDPEGIHLHGGPGSQFRSLAVIPKGTELPVLGEWVNGLWVPVSYQNRRGFIYAAYVSIRTTRGASPAASPSSPDRAPAASPLTDNGVVLTSVTATDRDGMITIGDAFELTLSARFPAGVDKVTMRLRGAPFLPFSATFPVKPGENRLSVPAFRVDSEWEPVLREEIIRKVGGTVPIRDGALEVAFVFAVSDGDWRSASFKPAVVDAERTDQIARIQYPDLKRITGLPPQGAGRQNYYLRGNADFHHPDDFYVRKLAIEAARRGGIFPDDPEQVADNIFRYINSLLGDADPGDFNNDLNLARLIDDGTIVRGRRNGGYICIGQTYLMTALTRTLGLPSRELNIAVGRPSWLGNDGYWRVEWWQEAAVHTWYKGGWHHYDLWLGFKGFDGYFEENLAYQAWAAFAPQSTPFTTISGAGTGLRGHNFAVWPGNPPQWEFTQEGTRPGIRVYGMPEGDAAASAGWDLAKRIADGNEAPRGPAIQVATPPARRIRDRDEAQP